MKYISKLFLVLIFFYLIFIIRPAIFGQLNGLFTTTKIPNSYSELKNLIESKNSYFRIAWFPSFVRYGYVSYLNIPVSLNDYFGIYNNNKLADKIRENEKLLQLSAIKYIIIPDDVESKIFLTDRKYDEKKYQEALKELEKISWLKKVKTFGKIVVFEVPNSKEHFWTDSKTLKFNYKYISPVEYKINILNGKIGDKIIFSESFDARWYARDIKDRFYDWASLIGSNPYERKFNSFTLRKSGSYTLDVYYYPQILVNVGIAISLISLVSVIIGIFYFKKK